MQIVQLENHVSNFDKIVDDSFWSEFGDFTSYERTSQDDVIKRSFHADVLLINKTVLGNEEFDRLPNLRYVGVLATGYNVVDLKAARAHHVVVTNIPSYSTESVAQLTFSHILNFARSVETHSKVNWSGLPDFSCCLTPQTEINGLTIGLVGFGAIARSVARIANAFGMNVVTFTRSPEKVDVPYVKAVAFDELLSVSDIVSLHCPLTDANHRMINEKSIAEMKDGAYLINTARGGLVDENALYRALISGKLGGAGLDVLSQEPPSPDNPLLSCSSCKITPHIAWASKQARVRLYRIAKENVRAWCSGHAVNVVS